MAKIYSLANKLAELLFYLFCIPLLFTSRQRLVTYLILVPLGSLVFDHYDLPRFFLTEKRSVANMVFAKNGYGWTAAVMCLFWTGVILRSSVTCSPLRRLELSRLMKPFIRIGIVWIMWIVLAMTFGHLEKVSSVCEVKNSPTKTAISKKKCFQLGGDWTEGFDVSGHIIVQIMANLIMADELQFAEQGGFNKLNTKAKGRINRAGRVMRITALIGMSALQLLWDALTFVSVAYFHEPAQKMVAFAAGLFCWFCVYVAHISLPLRT